MIWWGGVRGSMNHKVSRPWTCSSMVLVLRINLSVLSGQILVSQSGTEPRSWRRYTERRRAERLSRSDAMHCRVRRIREERNIVVTEIMEWHRAGWSRTGSMDMNWAQTEKRGTDLGGAATGVTDQDRVAWNDGDSIQRWAKVDVSWVVVVGLGL